MCVVQGGLKGGNGQRGSPSCESSERLHPPECATSFVVVALTAWTPRSRTGIVFGLALITPAQTCHHFISSCKEFQIVKGRIGGALLVCHLDGPLECLLCKLKGNLCQAAHFGVCLRMPGVRARSTSSSCSTSWSRSRGYQLHNHDSIILLKAFHVKYVMHSLIAATFSNCMPTFLGQVQRI